MALLPLSQQTVLITGAANGLGRALVSAFHAAGAQLALVDFDEARLLEVAQHLPGTSTHVADLSNRAITRQLIHGIQSQYGTVHTLIHNAGFLRPQSFQEMPEDRWELTFNVGIQAAYLLTKAFWSDWLQGGGTGIYVSSRSGVEGFADEVAYCSTKHAMEGFVKSLALEAPSVMLHSVTPGMYMRTPMSAANYSDELKSKWIDPIELAPAFLHLAMQRNKSLSGKRVNAWELSETIRAAQGNGGRLAPPD